MAMNCQACADARRNRYSGGYRHGCLGCDLRGLSRSVAAMDALAMRNDKPFRDALALSHPNLDIDVAISAIRAWWRLDHEGQE
jgi:hypothetical protein